MAAFVLVGNKDYNGTLDSHGKSEDPIKLVSGKRYASTVL